MKKWLASFTLLFLCFSILAQKEKKPAFTVQYSSVPKIHARAIVANETSIYLGTNEGSVFEIAANGTKSLVLNFEKRPFRELRDMLIVNEKLLVMASGDTSAILIYNINTRKIERTQIFNGVFLDGLAEEKGKIFAMGDPVNGYFSLFEADETKLNFVPVKAPEAAIGEAAFAASGTSVHRFGQTNYFFTGGTPHMYYQADYAEWKKVALPYSPCAACGPYTAYLGENRWFIAGGNYTEPNVGDKTLFFSDDKGMSWTECPNSSTGYRSVIFGQGKKVFTAGSNGIDYSKNNGKTWKKINNGNYVAGTIYKNWAVFSGMNGKLVFYKL